MTYTYQPPPSVNLTRDSDGASVPPDDPGLLAWMAEGHAPYAPPAPPDSPPPVGISWLGFMALFTQAEQVAIALSVDPNVAVFRMMAMGLGGDLILSDPRVAMGLQACAAAGCIASTRIPQILAQQAPV
jgi:hypothetical protein